MLSTISNSDCGMRGSSVDIDAFRRRYQSKVSRAFAEGNLPFGLAGGRSGAALSLLSTAPNTPDTQELIDELLWNDLEVMESATATLFSGASGVALVADIVTTTLGHNDYDEILCDFDDYLIDFLHEEEAASLHFDVISGISGIGIYALSRNRKQARNSLRMVSRCVDLLAACSRREGGLLTWLSEPRFVPARQLASNPPNSADLGVAHGVAGVLGFLAQAASVDGLHDQSSALLESGIRWLCAQRNPPEFQSTFAYRSKMPRESRTAWCYGDLGIAAVLASIPSFRQEITEACLAQMLDRQFSRSETSMQIDDAFLCHGFAGNYVLACALTSSDESSALASFAASMRERFVQAVADDFMQHEDAPLGFLEGYGGVLAAAHLRFGDPTPHWAAPFALLEPPRAGTDGL
jgi:lantibiotic modifying enzyme